MRSFENAEVRGEKDRKRVKSNNAVKKIGNCRKSMSVCQKPSGVKPDTSEGA